MNRLFWLNRLRWHFRVPAKWFVFALTVLLVCFPYPNVLIRHLRHWKDPNALVDPEAPALQPLVRELRPRLAADTSPRDALKVVERFVYETIRYDWDWNTWGTADYLPTLTEVLEMGREDCDGRAVVAASLLCKLGFKARIVTDFAHVWVKTEHGETMGPGKKKALVGEDDGLRISPGALSQIPRALAYGVAPFPLVRELIVVAMLWLLLLHPPGLHALPGQRGTWWVRVVGALVLLLAGLLLLRAGGRNYLHPTEWMQLGGIISMVAGVLALLAQARGTVHTPVLQTPGDDTARS